MGKRILKYATPIVLALCMHMVFADGRPVPESMRLAQAPPDSTAQVFSAPSDTIIPPSNTLAIIDVSTDSSDMAVATEQEIESVPGAVDLSGDLLMFDADGNYIAVDTTAADADTTRRKKGFLDEMITGHNRDSLVYDVRNKMVYIYNEGDVVYDNMNLKADYMQVDMETKIIYAYGVSDTLGERSRPEFYEGGDLYTMDTITYNIDTKKAKLKGLQTVQGEGYLIGRDIKKQPDNSIHIAHGAYTTCDHLDHPHFYLAMTKGKAIPNEKIIVGYSYLVMEDVPIYFPGLPFGFFPISTGRSSGFIVPSYGEESVKGFFIRNGGYYFAFNDYIDATVLGGIYSLGSWEASLSSCYVKRYHYSGGLNFNYSKNILGEKGSADYVNMGSYSIQWTHSQDAKFRPSSSFSASVNISSSGYNKYGSTNLNQYLSTQTNSSIAYSKSWPGKPYSLTTNFQHSQNSKDTMVSLTFPNVSFNVTRIYPFKRKEAIGKERWYEKISISYSGQLQNSVTAKEYDLFSADMFRNMKNGVSHSIPVSASWNLFNYLTITPSFPYTERWFFRKINKEWDPVESAQVVTDTTYGFYRVYNYSFSVSANTKIYGMFQFKEKDPEKKPLVTAIRHVITPTVGFQYTPDFGDAKYGFYKNIQSNTAGDIGYYSPYEGNAFSLPGRGKSASMNFSLQNNLEMKVRSKRDTTGTKKIKVIDNLSFSGNYNFLADSLNLSTISIQFRSSLIKNFGINVSATLDPYQVNENGTRINKFMFRKGKIGRITNASTSFGYTFNSSKSSTGAINDINSTNPIVNPYENDYYNDQDLDPATRRALMTAQYYDFDIPWNLGFSYSLSYSNNGVRKNVVQTLSFQGSANLTPKWGLSFNGGYDFDSGRLTPGVVTVTRDLHCWQMNFSWVPVGYRKSWSFNISVKSAILQDLKYDKRSSHYDNLYD